jgi:hypothetical protein
LRFREVLLSQTDHELSLVQVLCEMCVALCALLECNAALVQVRNEYYEGLQLLQDLLLTTEHYELLRERLEAAEKAGK